MGYDNQIASIVAFGVDTSTFTDSANLPSKYCDTVERVSLYSIKRVKIALYPSLEVVDLGISEYIEIFNGVNDKNLISYLGIEDSSLCDLLLSKLSIKDKPNYECFMCNKNNKLKFIGASVPVYDITSNNYISHIKDWVFIFKDTKNLGIIFDAIRNRLLFECRGNGLVPNLCTRYIPVIDYTERFRFISAFEAISVSSKYPMIDKCIHRVSNGYIDKYLDLTIVNVGKFKDTVLVDKDCLRLALRTSEISASVNTLVIGRNVKHISSFHIDINNIYYSKQCSNRLGIGQFMVLCARNKVKSLKNTDMANDLTRIAYSFKSDKDFDKLVNNINKLMNGKLVLQSY